jgi:hypothetical protein
MAIIKDALKSMEAMMPEDAVRRAHLAAEREILAIRLTELRQRKGVRQTDLKNFTQTSASKIEKRKDWKLSTLIEYLDDLGMGLELRTYPKKGKDKEKSETLLRI